jgi:hypothetical protein
MDSVSREGREGRKGAKIDLQVLRDLRGFA